MATLERGGGIGEYRIVEELRSGTAGAIFRAEQTALRRQVILHVAAPSASSGAGRRFLDVARLIARIDHPHLLNVYDVDVDGDVAFAAVREPPARSLGDVVAADGPLEPGRAVRLAEQLASVLETLDTAGISFDRIRPEDVFLEGAGDAEHAYLAPLGVLVDADAAAPVLESSPTRSGAALADLLSTVAGTPDAEPGSGTPSQVALAARRGLAPARGRRRRVIAAAAVAAAVAVAAGVVLATRSGDRPAANRPVAERVAVIPLGGSPRSLAVSEDAVWVATANGTALRVDPRTNEVVGQPIRFGKPDPSSNLTIRAGAGYVFVLDSSAGLLTRIDPRKGAVTGRLHLGGPVEGATVADGVVWVIRASPEGVEPPSYRLVRVDPATLHVVGKPYAVGGGAIDVHVRSGVALVVNEEDGTVTRVDPRRDSVRTALVGAVLNGSALHGGTLWVPDFWGDSVVPLDTSLAHPPATVVRGMHHPFSVAATAGALWVAALTGPSTSAPTVLARIDPASRRLIGRPVPLGNEIGWLTAGLGSIWVQDQAASTLVRYDPTRLPNVPPAPARRPTSPRTLAPGPLAAGAWRSTNPRVPFRLSIPGTGWLEVGPTTGPTAYEVELARFDAPDTSVSVIAPTQLFLPDGRVEPVPDVSRIVRALRANRHLVVRMLPSSDVGGVRATRLLVDVKPYRGYPTFCPAACVPVFGFPNNTSAVGAPSVSRLSLVPFHGKVIVVFEQTGRAGGSLTRTASLVRSLRLG